jgi:4-amino-4-deoxy-L-arabinose transferase-like glycosyltransferase
MHITQTLKQTGNSLIHLAQRINWEKVVLVALVVILPLLMYYNLGINPRPWHDEGASLLVARTLAEDGVYAMRNSDGYQTFGPIQSIGPTVVLPIAGMFKLFGAGLFQGRLVMATYSLITLLLFYFAGKKLFGGVAALCGTIILIGSPAVLLLLYGRETLGEVPAFGFFLASWIACIYAIESKRYWVAAISGLLLGAAIITKSQYLIIGIAAIGILVVLDLVYYRQGVYKQLALIGFLGIACMFAWQAWQVYYYGWDVYMENGAKLGLLAKVSTGFRPRISLRGMQAIFGSDSGNFYLFWGLPALAYAGLLSIRKNKNGIVLALPMIFTCLWLAYFIFWIIPWQHYALAPMAIIALFIGKIYADVARSLAPFFRDFWQECPKIFKGTGTISPKFFLYAGALIAVLSFGLWTGYQIQQNIRTYVLDTAGDATNSPHSPPQLQNPAKVAAFLNAAVNRDEVIETWERELGILTDHKYHFPDQSMLAHTHAAVYLQDSEDYRLGEEYFSQIKPAYVIIGWFERTFPIYNMEYLSKRGELIETIGYGDYSYSIYKMHY